MQIPIFHVDAFSDVPFKGNPAAVCLLDRPMPVSWMQAVAYEMNLPETAFVESLGGNGVDFGLRWFTPLQEVPLCGHATLATGHVLWEEDRARSNTILFSTNSGILSATKQGSSIGIDLPSSLDEAFLITPELNHICDKNIRYCARSGTRLIFELQSESEVRSLKPDLTRLGKTTFDGLIVTARAEESQPYDYVCRCFAPKLGVNEDPVTGSAQCSLGPYWSRHLGKKVLRGYQASERGGHFRVTVQDARVYIEGEATIVSKGIFCATTTVQNKMLNEFYGRLR